MSAAVDRGSSAGAATQPIPLHGSCAVRNCVARSRETDHVGGHAAGAARSSQLGS